MWHLVRGLQERGVTIILTTHYIEDWYSWYRHE
jgi:ABC-type multidrug transport system ATPase subunit